MPFQMGRSHKNVLMEVIHSFLYQCEQLSNERVEAIICPRKQALPFTINQVAQHPCGPLTWEMQPLQCAVTHTRREDGETQQRKGKTQNASLLWPGGWPWAHPGSHERKSIPSHI